jgi:hypothetical protein
MFNLIFFTSRLCINYEGRFTICGLSYSIILVRQSENKYSNIQQRRYDRWNNNNNLFTKLLENLEKNNRSCLSSGRDIFLVEKIVEL